MRPRGEEECERADDHRRDPLDAREVRAARHRLGDETGHARLTGERRRALLRDLRRVAEADHQHEHQRDEEQEDAERDRAGQHDAAGRDVVLVGPERRVHDRRARTRRFESSARVVDLVREPLLLCVGPTGRAREPSGLVGLLFLRAPG